MKSKEDAPHLFGMAPPHPNSSVQFLRAGFFPDFSHFFDSSLPQPAFLHSLLPSMTCPRHLPHHCHRPSYFTAFPPFCPFNKIYDVRANFFSWHVSTVWPPSLSRTGTNILCDPQTGQKAGRQAGRVPQTQKLWRKNFSTCLTAQIIHLPQFKV